MGIGDGDKDTWVTTKEIKTEVKMSMDKGWR